MLLGPPKWSDLSLIEKLSLLAIAGIPVAAMLLSFKEIM